MSSEARRAALTELHAAITRGVTQLFDTAVAIEEPVGLSEEWLSLLGYYGVAPISEQERVEVRAAQRPERGAALMELSQMVVILSKWARREVKRIDVDIIDDPSDVQIMHERLLRLTDRIANELDIAYRQAVLPKRQGMFANATAHHDPSQKSWTKANAHAFKCRTCGAPRLKAGEDTCPFCGNPMAG
jgi:hypothetical protein